MNVADVLGIDQAPKARPDRFESADGKHACVGVFETILKNMFLSRRRQKHQHSPGLVPMLR